MSKNILIIRSANFSVIDILVDYINKRDENVNIFFLAQENSIKDIEQNIPNAKIFACIQGSYNYKEFKCKKELHSEINRTEYDEIYIPSSYEHFEDFDEVKLISASIKAKKYIMFNCYGETKEENLNFNNLFFSYKLTYPFKFALSVFVFCFIYIVSFLYHIVKYHILRKEV